MTSKRPRGCFPDTRLGRWAGRWAQEDIEKGWGQGDPDCGHGLWLLWDASQSVRKPGGILGKESRAEVHLRVVSLWNIGDHVRRSVHSERVKITDETGAPTLRAWTSLSPRVLLEVQVLVPCPDPLHQRRGAEPSTPASVNPLGGAYAHESVRTPELRHIWGSQIF